MTLTYDALGNIDTRSSFTGDYTYGHGGSPYRLVDAGADITATAYDANGNITGQERFGETLGIGWTAFNKPAFNKPAFNKPAFIAVGNNKSTFRYDASGNRVAHVVRENGVDTRKTLYIGGFEQSRVKDGGNWVTDYTRISVSSPTGVVGTYDHKAAATSAAGNTRSYYHYYHLGTIVAVTGSWLDDSEAINPYLETDGRLQTR